MKTTTITPFNPSFFLSPNPKSPITDRTHILPLTRTKFPVLHPSGPFSLSIIVKCSSEQTAAGSGGAKGSLRDALSGMVGDRVDELLNREENRALFDGLEEATQRVEMAKRELAEIERQELEAKMMRDYINQLESRASKIAECQKEILDARAMVEEAGRSLSNDSTNLEISEEMKKNEERSESIKAASISALAGTIAALPISLTRVTSNSQLILPLAITFLSCALFGVTFRYAIRRDLDNFQLKSGTSAAFGFVKGLGTLGGGPPLELEGGSILSHALDGAVYVSENLLIFLFASVSLDLCFKLRILSPFPIERSVPRR